LTQTIDRRKAEGRMPLDTTSAEKGGMLIVYLNAGNLGWSSNVDSVGCSLSRGKGKGKEPS